ncbi:enterotoxin A family protein [Streptomyces asoensis]|uniref:scabin-related ADP-ribosyltransferase n=1 Tax=Streptomyces asoensis TaxID=249586 RepID=UPI0033303E9A
MEPGATPRRHSGPGPAQPSPTARKRSTDSVGGPSRNFEAKSADIAATYFGGRGGYVYEIKGAPGGIDVNDELGPLSPSPHEKEVAYGGGISWEYVTRVWQKDEWGEI